MNEKSFFKDKSSSYSFFFKFYIILAHKTINLINTYFNFLLSWILIIEYMHHDIIKLYIKLV